MAMKYDPYTDRFYEDGKWMDSGTAVPNLNVYMVPEYIGMPTIQTALKEVSPAKGINLVYQDLEKAIRKVIFHDPATIVFWYDGTKTVVKAHNEIYDPEKGLAMAIIKKFMPYPDFKRLLSKYYAPEPTVGEDIIDGLREAIHSPDRSFSQIMSELATSITHRISPSDILKGEANESNHL